MAKKSPVKRPTIRQQPPIKKYLGPFSFIIILVLGFTYALYQHPPGFLIKWWGRKTVAQISQEEKGYYYGLPGEPVSWPTGQVVRGIDVSRYQTHVKWPEVKKHNITFVFVKATEGFLGRDRLFQKHWQKIGQAGFVRGAYHFYRSNQPAWLQAINFLTQVEIGPGDLPPVLDVEQAGYATDEELRDRVRTWLRWVEWQYGVKPIIYTNYSFYKYYFEGFFEEYPFWIAHYQVDKLKLTDYNRKQVKFWQHTDRGAVPGIEGRVDCNVFYGSKTALKQLCVN